MVDVIILAGGKSTRMKQNKMLLEIEGKPVILHTINSFKNIDCNIIVVTGKYHEDISEKLCNQNIKIVNNINYELGMFSSVKAGVSQVKNSFLIIPGDCPFVEENTIKKILNGKGKIRIPQFEGLDGHPIYFDYCYKEEILAYDDNYNLKMFRDSHKYEIIKVTDKYVVTNLNNFLDYTKITTERKDSTHES